MAKQPKWTAHPDHASWYSRMTKADFCDAAALMARRLQYLSLKEIKEAIEAEAKRGKENHGRI
jgi:hypothetical protein